MDVKNELPGLNLPPAALELRPGQGLRGAPEVFDVLRRRWVTLTPEEWVRQNFVAFLLSHRAYPAGLIANEYALRLNGTMRRCDTIVFDRSLRPLVVVEYKAPSVLLTQKTFDQIARYNIVMQAPYLIVSNGLTHYCCRFGGNSYSFLDDIPGYGELVGGSTPAHT